MKKKGEKATARARARASERESNSNLFYLVLLQECTEKFESRSPRARARKRIKRRQSFWFFFSGYQVVVFSHWRRRSE